MNKRGDSANQRASGKRATAAGMKLLPVNPFKLTKVRPNMNIYEFSSKSLGRRDTRDKIVQDSEGMIKDPQIFLTTAVFSYN